MAFDRKTLLATTFIAGIAMAAPSMAFAQSQEDEDDQRPRPSSQQATQVGEVVITGSRIRRNEFTATQPIQVITAEQATLEGLADTSEILQGSTAANTATQINNFFTGFVTTGGPGVNTISLRGLGAQRTLVIINGRRAGPAGARGTVGPTDLNTIPGSLIERVEILTDGASSIYGSDAVAGVINIITRTNLDGGRAEFIYNQPFQSGGEELRASIAQGWTFDRGYVSAAADFYRRSPLRFGDRDYLDCPQDRFYRDPNYQVRADLIDPATGDFKCFQIFNATLRLSYAGGDRRFARAGDYVFDSTAVDNYPGFNGASIWGNAVTPVFCPASGSAPANTFNAANATVVGPCAPGSHIGWNTAQGQPYNLNGFRIVSGGSLGLANHPTAPNTAVRRALGASVPQTNPSFSSRTAVSPVDRYSISAFAGYDLTPNTEFFAELLLNRRESEQNSWRQLFPTVSPGHTNNPFGGPFNPGITVTPNAGHFVLPIATVPLNNDQRVDYYRAVAGLRGSLAVLGGWDWELAAQYSRSDARYGGNFFYKDRVFAAAMVNGDTGAAVVSAPDNCATVFLLPGSPVCPAGGVNWFTPAFVNTGQLSAAEMAYIMGYEVGTTIYTHQYVEGIITGNLFNLPAGPVGAAFGFQIRREEIDDTPGPEARRSNSWGLTSAARTAGSDNIREVFAEVELPLFRNAFLMDSFTLNLSGRYSDYDSYGSNSTYKVGINWQITPSWRIRASQGDSFRAPALYELFLGNQTSFAGQTAIDPCTSAAARNSDPILNANCLADGVPITYNGGGTSSAEVVTGGGIGVLNPETAEAQSIGVIWTPSFIDLSVALDYYKIEVFDQVQQFGSANIVNACYRSDIFPAEPLCSLITRDTNPGSTRFNQIIRVNDSYVNIARQESEGLDLNIRYGHRFGFGDLLLTGRFTHILNWETQIFNASAPTRQHGRIGQPDFVGQVSARLDRGDWTYFWSTDIVGETSNADFLTPPNTGTFFGEPVFFKRFTDHYITSNASIRRRMDQWTLQFGIQNIFDTPPPFTSSSGGGTRIGNAPLASQYDLIGRRAFFNISRSW